MEEILARIPQRPPFLFVDEIVSEEEGSIVTARTFSADEDFFKGHFPEKPVVPGVLLQEALFQTGALLLSSGQGAGLGMVTRVGGAKFKRVVGPGDRIEMHVSLVEQVANAYVMKGKITLDSKVAAMVDFTVAQVSQ
jgi:3-hydroxyacyl-[acyl-carrier-protein] dehydratase